MGRHYPLGSTYFRARLHKAFESQAHLPDEAKILEGIKRADYVKKGELLQRLPVFVHKGEIANSRHAQKSKHCQCSSFQPQAATN